VLIDVAAAGLDGGDLLQRRSPVPPSVGSSPLPGLERTGRIAAFGPGVDVVLTDAVKAHRAMESGEVVLMR
jgi:NADPH:quinone reductase-like Zn-dependent oxidoreductase